MGMKSQLLYTGNEFMADLSNIVIWLVSIAGALMTLYAVYIGYLFATASDEGKRKTAKSRLIKLISTIFIVYALAATLNVIKVTFTTIEKSKEEDTTNTDWTSVEYSYAEIPELVLDVKDNNYKSSIVFYPRAITVSSGTSSLSGIKITNFTFFGEAVYGLNELCYEQKCTMNPDGSLSFDYTSKKKSDLEDDVVIIVDERKGPNSGWVQGQISFDIGEIKGLQVSVKILLNDNTTKINIQT